MNILLIFLILFVLIVVTVIVYSKNPKKDCKSCSEYRSDCEDYSLKDYLPNENQVIEMKVPPVEFGRAKFSRDFGIPPMLTAVVPEREFKIGQWVRVGVAYSRSEGRNDNKNEHPTTVEIQQFNIDPVREIYSYRVLDPLRGMVYTLDIPRGLNYLENGDEIYVPELGKKLIFKKDSDYEYVWI
jgi:hypothetical protein